MSLKNDNKRLYGIWSGMRSRCRNPNRPKYTIYGGRGIKICDEWESFANFYQWAMANGYRDDLSIDRIDNNGDYCPSNCRWATAQQQCRNRSCTLKVFFAGEVRTVYEVAAMVGADYYFLRSRIRRGMDIEEAVSLPKMTIKKNRRNENAV